MSAFLFGIGTLGAESATSRITVQPLRQAVKEAVTLIGFVGVVAYSRRKPLKYFEVGHGLFLLDVLVILSSERVFCVFVRIIMQTPAEKRDRAAHCSAPCPILLVCLEDKC
jgi:hypothetical protein